MPADADRSEAADRAVGELEVPTPPRSAEEILRDLEQERAGLVAAVDQLKAEATAARAKWFSTRNFAIAGGVVVLLIALRIWRKKR